MAALTLKVTPEGRAALRNAQGNGTNAVLVATAGLSATAFNPGDAPPNEIKRVATIAGGATAADTIHVTISDTGGDVYSVRGFALYLSDGTRFASYGQADIIVQKSAQAAMLLAVDVQFADIAATQITFGDSNFSNPQATTEMLGVVELATDDEATAGADAQRVVTAKSLLAVLNGRFGIGAPSAFVKKLLPLATAAAIWAQLQIKGAAGFDPGSGNGLDADLLDGKDGSYYLAWSSLTGVPGSFTPSPHVHAAADVTSGTFPVVRGGTGLASVPAGYILVGAANGTDALVPRSPDQLRLDIQAAASSHSHIISNVTGLQDGLDGKAAKVHTHVIADVAGLQPALDAKFSTAGGVVGGRVFIDYEGNFVGAYMTAVKSGGREFALGSVGANWGGGLPAGTWVLYDNSPGGGTRFYVTAAGDAGITGSLSVAGNLSIGQNGNSFQKVQWPNGNSFWARAVNNADTGIGGAYADWAGNRAFALQVDAQNTQAAYGIWRVTRWGDRHIAAMDAYYNGGNMRVDLHCGRQQTHWFEQNGNITALGTMYAAGGFYAGSSRKIKTQLRRMPYGLSDVLRIETKRGRFKKKYNKDGRSRLFLIAEQLAGVIPEAVFEGDHERPTSVDHNQLFPVLIEAIKQLAKRLEQLESKVKK